MSMVEAMGGWQEDAAALITKLANHTGKEADENASKCSVNIFSISDIKQDDFRLPIRL
jgi:hypothetical protein